MATMHFMSTLEGQPTKFVNFDSSPGRAIAQRLGAGLWDERSYDATLKQEDVDETVYEIRMRQNAPPEQPDRVMPLVKVGVLRHTPTLA